MGKLTDAMQQTGWQQTTLAQERGMNVLEPWAGWRGYSTGLSPKGLCTSLPMTTSQPGPGRSALDSKTPPPQGAYDEGNMGSHIR